MSDQHTKGAADTIQGNVKEAAGKVTGDRTLEAKGKGQQVEGKARDGLGDIGDALKKRGHD